MKPFLAKDRLLKLVSEEEPLNLLATFKREALHLEMRDVYAVMTPKLRSDGPG